MEKNKLYNRDRPVKGNATSHFMTAKASAMGNAKNVKTVAFLSRVAPVVAPVFASLLYKNLTFQQRKRLTFPVGLRLGVWTVTRVYDIKTASAQCLVFAGRGEGGGAILATREADLMLASQALGQHRTSTGSTSRVQ